jgi:hypothetical protein
MLVEVERMQVQAPALGGGGGRQAGGKATKAQQAAWLVYLGATVH